MPSQMLPDRELPPPLADVVATALGQRSRPEPVEPVTGGPAGNAQLTAWLGLTLLVLGLAELATLVDVRGLLTWHVVIGILLIPPSLAKTAITGWRMVRYYAGHPAYVQAGPPPLLLRLLGPAVVGATLAVLGTGVLVALLGPDTALRPWLRLPGLSISAFTLHQASVVAWAAATGLHVLARLVPAVQIVRRARVSIPGLTARVGVIAGTVGLAGVLAFAGRHLAGQWAFG